MNMDETLTQIEEVIAQYKEADEAAEKSAKQGRALTFLSKLHDLREKPWAIGKTWVLKRRSEPFMEIEFTMRSKNHFWGRFGGGWNWMLGIQVGGTSTIIHLLVCSVRIWYKRAQWKR